MNIRALCTIILFSMTLFPVHAEELIENGDFSLGERKWDVDGKIDVGSENEPKFVVTLNKRRWTYVEQKLEYGRDLPVSLNIQLELKASDDFKPVEESKEYSKVNFTMGGSWRWSSIVQPKVDMLIRLDGKDYWYYFPRKLSTGGDLEKIQINLKGLSIKKGMFTIGFPPGTGSVELKKISVIKG